MPFRRHLPIQSKQQRHPKTKCEICTLVNGKNTRTTSVDVVLVSLLLTLNRCCTLM